MHFYRLIRKRFHRRVHTRVVCIAPRLGDIRNIDFETIFSRHERFSLLTAKSSFMVFRAETITVLPALFLFMMASYLAFLTFQVVDSSAKKALVTRALGLFLGGLVLTACWFYYWGIRKKIPREQK